MNVPWTKLKGPAVVSGLNLIQWTCVAGICVLVLWYLNDRRAARGEVLENVALG